MGDIHRSKPVWVEVKLCVETNKLHPHYRTRLTDCCGDYSTDIGRLTPFVMCNKCGKGVEEGQGDGTQTIPIRKMTERHYRIEPTIRKEQLDD